MLRKLGKSPGLLGDIYAETPELGSIALFGSGAMGAIGYALLRRRAAHR